MEDDGFTAFVVARQRALQRTAWLLTGDWAAAEDLVAQVLAKMWLNWGRIRRRDDPHVYACRVLINTHATAWRRAWRRELPHAELPESGTVEPSSAVDTRRAVLDALRRLPRRQRQVLILRYFEDLSEWQTASAMGVALGTVKSTTAAALATLREDIRLTESVGEPVRAVDADSVRRIGRTRRRRQIALAGAVAVGLVLAVPALFFTQRRVAPVSPLGTVCAPTSVATNDPLPAQFEVVTVITCKTELVHRPGQGLWLRVTEQHAVEGAAEYGRALKIVPSPTGCPSGVFIDKDPPPSLVADADGHVASARIPRICIDVTAQLAIARQALTWQPATSRWIVQMVSEANADGPCASTWRSPYLDRTLAPVLKAGIAEQSQAPDVICFVRGLPDNPGPPNFVQGRLLSGAAAAPVLAALGDVPGVPGPDPTGQQVLDQRCTDRSKGAYELTVDGTVIGYADLGACMRAVGPDLGPAPADVVTLIQQTTGVGP